MAKLFGPFLLREMAVSGVVASGYYVETFEPDNAYTTKKSVYKDAGMVTPHPNPFQISSEGFSSGGKVYLDGAIDYKVYDGDPDAGGNQVDSVRNAGDTFSAHATDLSNLILNASFEVDEDADNTPDNWTLFPHDNHTMARVIDDSSHGTASLKTVVSDAGGSTARSSIFELSHLDTLIGGMAIKSTNSGMRVRAQLILFDKDQVSLSATQTIYDSEDLPSTFTDIRFSSLDISAAETSSRYGQLQLKVDDSGQTGDVHLDNIWMKKREILSAEVTPRGLVVSRSDGDSSHDINVTAGSVKADDGEYDLILDQEITKKMDVSFVAGDDQGGAATGFSIPTESLVYIYLIGSSTTGAVDVLIDDSASSPSLPSDFDKKRRIFCWPTDANGNLVAGFHDGLDRFFSEEEIVDLEDTTLTEDVYETGTFLCPPNGEYFFSCQLTTTNNDYWNDGFVKTCPTSADWSTRHSGFDLASQLCDDMNFRGSERCDSSSTFKYGSFFTNTATIKIIFNFLGYRDIGRNIL